MVFISRISAAQALQILQRIPGEVIQKLGMHELVARPEALILCTLPVPPSGSRVKERLGKEKSSSSYTAIPQVHMVGVNSMKTFIRHASYR